MKSNKLKEQHSINGTNKISQTKNLTIDEAVVGVYRELYPEYIRGLNIRPASKEFSKIVEKELILTSFDLKNESVLINLDNLNNALNKIEKDSLRIVVDTSNCSLETNYIFGARIYKLHTPVKSFVITKEQYDILLERFKPEVTIKL